MRPFPRTQRAPSPSLEVRKEEEEEEEKLKEEEEQEKREGGGKEGRKGK